MQLLVVALCTTFLLERGNERVVGKSYDWNMGQGLVMVNQRGMKKQALPMTPHPAAWTSKFSSVTFNQYGRELPNGGMNQAGLVVEVMWLDSSTYPPPDARPTVSELQWIQYQLDNFSTVKEMVEAAQSVRVQLVHGKVHYLACDASGDCAAFEHVDGKMVVSHPVRALTNDTYADSIAFAKRGPQKGRGSLERFSRANNAHAPEVRGDLTQAAFGVLDDVSQGPRSVWNIVYDPVHLTVSFRTSDDKRLRWFDFRKLERSCGTPVKLLDLHADVAGDVTQKFVDYSDAANQKLLNESVGPMVKQLPPGALEALAKYPSQLECTR
jgi:penicillin V acylase-like amidase (Ntn superfamily)